MTTCDFGHTVREMEPSDIDQAIELSLKNPGPHCTERRWEEIVSSRQTRSVVAELEGTILAYAVVFSWHPMLHLSEITTHPLYRSNGIATTLIDDLKEWGNKHKYREIITRVHHGNLEAYEFFEVYGFQFKQNISMPTRQNDQRHIAYELKLPLKQQLPSVKWQGEPRFTDADFQTH